MAERFPRAARGPATALLAVYAIFTVAALSRSLVQLTLHAERAPIAYWLSLGAAVVYGIGLTALWRVSRGAPSTIGWLWCLVELGGVVVVGALSIVVPSWFPEPSVWSGFGSGYGFVPTVLPLLALWWLRSVDRGRRDVTNATPGPAGGGPVGR